MSLHAQLSPEAQAKLATQKRNSTISSIIIAILLCALLAIILWIIALDPFYKNTEETVSYTTPSDTDTEVTEPETSNEVETTPSSPASSMANLIASNTPSPTSVPIPEITTAEPSVDFGYAEEFGEGWGNSIGNSSSTGRSSAFGRVGETGMAGHFYDLKQNKKQKISSLGKLFAKPNANKINIATAELKHIQRSRYSRSRLNEYYKANKKLMLTHLAMAQVNADSAPKAFDVEDEVQASGWIVVYEGTMTSDFNKEFRFIGRYDDLMLVYVNGKVVFDGSWSAQSKAFDKDATYEGPSLINIPMMASPYLTMNRGDKVRIVIGEFPGGLVGGGLFVQEKDKEYRKSDSGHNILPPFATDILHPDELERLESLKIPVETKDIPIFKIQ